MRQIMTLLVLVAVVAGCGSSGAASPTATPTPPKLTTSTDSSFGFSFRHPVDWTVAAKGHTISQGGVSTYVLDITTPGNAAGMSITVDSNVIPIPSFLDGKHGKVAGDPHTYVYYHRTVGQWPAMRIERFLNSQLGEIDTIVNTRTKSYDVRCLAATPPFSSSILAGYDAVVKTLKIPFS